jgi:SnoaL-like domain
VTTEMPSAGELRRLIDRDAIRDLAVRYGLAVDSKDLEALAQLFDAEASFGRWGKGPEGVKVFYDNTIRAFRSSMHMVGNHIIDFDDDNNAHGIVYCRAHHHYAEPDYWGDLAFAYFDKYVRRDGKWGFTSRAVRSWYRQTFGHPEQGNERSVVAGDRNGPVRGTQLPEAFPTWHEFWARQPAAKPS